MNTQFSKVYACYVWNILLEIWLQKCKINKENNVMHVNSITNDAWKIWLVKNLKIEKFPISIGRTLIRQRLREVESVDSKLEHFRSVESIFDWSNNVNSKTLKIWKFYAEKKKKKNLKSSFSDLMQMHMIQKSFKNMLSLKCKYQNQSRS